MPKFLEDDGLGCLPGDVPGMKALRSILRMEDYDLVQKQKCLGDEGRPRERVKMEAQAEAFTKANVMWDTLFGNDGAGAGGEWIQKLMRHPASEGKME